MDIQPEQRDLSRSERRWRIVAILLCLASVGFMSSVGLLPLLGGQLPGPSVRFLTLVAIAIVIGSQVVPAGSRPALMLLWAAMGMTMALGTIGIFSIGMFYLMAFALLVMALVVSPNRSGLASRADWHSGFRRSLPSCA